MGGSNRLFKVFTNPAALILKDRQSWVFDPIGTHLTQGVINWKNWLTGKEEFGNHKDWWGMGESHFGNEWMRKWTEGKKYKEWDDWEGKQKSEYEESSAKYYGHKPKLDSAPDVKVFENRLDTDHVYKNAGTTRATATDESLLSGSLKSDIY